MRRAWRVTSCGGVEVEEERRVRKFGHVKGEECEDGVEVWRVRRCGG